MEFDLNLLTLEPRPVPKFFSELKLPWNPGLFQKLNNFQNYFVPSACSKFSIKPQLAYFGTLACSKF